jgi:Ca2+-binding RTX toxin-like protein
LGANARGDPSYGSTRLGGDGNDLLLGGRGADQLDGGTGNDSLERQGGRDTLAGGTGSNTCDVDTTDVATQACTFEVVNNQADTTPPAITDLTLSPNRWM